MRVKVKIEIDVNENQYNDYQDIVSDFLIQLNEVNINNIDVREFDYDGIAF